MSCSMEPNKEWDDLFQHALRCGLSTTQSRKWVHSQLRRKKKVKQPAPVDHTLPLFPEPMEGVMP